MRTKEELCEVLGVPFSDQQLEAITAPLEPAVIIAGAGTGKTTVMAARVVWLVATGQVRPSEVLGLTFTRKAAGELGSRIRGALEVAGFGSDEEEGLETVSTYDSFAANIVAEFGVRGGLDIEPRMITGATRFQLAEKVVRSAEGPFPQLSRLRPQTVAERILELDAAMQSHLVSVEGALAFNSQARAGFSSAPGKGSKGATPYAGMVQAAAACDERAELLSLVKAYQALKRENGVVEFGDQLRTAEALVRTVPSIPESMRSRFAVVLLDEYQDTSAAQAKLLTGLFADHPVTAVGDPYQAIYGWRGAAAQNILDFAKDFADGRAEEYTLDINRRSHHRILKVGNAVVASISDAGGVELSAPNSAPAGTVEAWRFDTEDQEIGFLADRIQELGVETPWKEMAVLCRVNSAMGPIFEALRSHGIPTEIVGLDGLLELPEIVPIIASLRVLADPTANASLATLLTSSRWNIGLKDMQLLGRHALELGAGDRQVVHDEAELVEALEKAVAGADPGRLPSLLEAVFDPPATMSVEGRRRVGALADEIRQLAKHVHEPISDLAQRVIRALGIEEELLARGMDTTQLAKFVKECADFAVASDETGLDAFLAHIAAEAEHGVGLEQAFIAQEDSVKLLSVHRAKGLEWDVVFLPGLSESVFPATYRSGHWPHKAEVLPAPLRGDAAAVKQMEDYSEDARKKYVEELKEEHLKSEDRLAYVAATRARKHLVGSRYVWRAGRKTPLASSRYFDVIWSEAVEGQEAFDHLTELEENPLGDRLAQAAWPPAGDDHAERQRTAAELVRTAQQGNEWVVESGTLPAEVESRLEQWDASVAHVLAARAHGSRRTVTLPQGLSATALIALRDDPQAFAEGLLRRMPRKPSAHAHLGTQFHEWIERRFQAPLSFDEIDQRPKGLEQLIDAFERGRFANRTPLAIEVPFSMAAGSFQVRGRIDAVYKWDGKEFDELVVDWKTSDAPADDLQLAVYRRAWAESRGIPEQRVGAAFYHVRSDRLVFADVDSNQIISALGL